MIDRARRILRESAIVYCINLAARTPGVLASLPIPTDSPSLAIAGPDPYRLLLIGSGIVAGSGVASHALGVGGHLARYVSGETGRGVNLDVVPLPSLLMRFARSHLSRIDLARYDAVILASGVNDAFGLTGRRGWRRSLASTLKLLTGRLPATRHVFLLAIADPRPSPIFRLAAAKRASARATVFNEESRRLLKGDPDVSVIDFEIGSTVDTHRLYNSASYLGWARQLGPFIVEGLDGSRPTA